MPIRIVRLGMPRDPHEGLRIGTVRRPPRGVRKEDYAALDYFDVWLPELAPSAELLSWTKSVPVPPEQWSGFARKYRREMNEPAVRRLILLLAELSKSANFSVGCYCEDEARCHRSVLKDLLIECGAKVRSPDI